MKDLVHLKLKYSEDKPALCGEKSYTYRPISTYLKYPNLNGFPYYHYTEDYEWCPDCITHPNVIMAKLNGTNV